MSLGKEKKEYPAGPKGESGEIRHTHTAPKIVEAPGLPDSSNSQQETLELEAQKSKHNREQGLFNLFHYILSFIVVIISLFVICSIVLVGWHIMAPVKNHWLNEWQFEMLVTILTSGVLSILAREAVNSYFKKK